MQDKELEDLEIKAEIDEIMESVNQVVQRLEKHGLLNKKEDKSSETEGRSIPGAGAGTVGE
ncbi:hypothetical protein [Desulfatibacillum aliphaticivorans]|uniref:Uncharacterized protein n=1 Tax=Desulfatibacillum aliphaticivorans TaxID=218208 RepID=B8FKL5_DESAL|nr:hypothetical protein [Desulfatibacillum aliphaticivorans]ACL01830.1 hypothetical protein Dalk_0120 [Desulfatibacillum aliphaticivorans]